MRSWVIGETGQLARAIKASRPALLTLSREQLDLSQSAGKIEDRLTTLAGRYGRPAAIILAAAYTDVDGAQAHPDLAGTINGVAPGAIAAWCAGRGVPLIHISTDYVFAGTGSAPYRANDKTAPVNEYGKSKLAGESAVMAAGAAGAIIRTAWLYDAKGPNFLTAMIDQNAAGNPLRVVDDQIGRPTYAPDLARAVLAATDALIQTPTPVKIYHATNTGAPVSWAGFARAILPAARITGVPSTEYKRAAARPAYSVLDTSEFERDFRTPLRPWKDALVCALKDRGGQA